MKDLRSRTLLTVFLAVVLLLASMAFAGCGSKSTTITTGEEEQDQDEGASPEDVAAKFFRAVEKQDAGALAGLFDPDSLEEIKDAMGSDYRSAIEEFFFEGVPYDVDFKGLKYDTEIDGKEATVEVVKGTVTYTDEYGDEATEDVRDWEDVMVFHMVKVKGEWYISVATFPDLVAEYDIPDTGTDTTINPNPNPNPQPAAEYVTCPDCGGWGGWEIGTDTACFYCNGSGVQDVQYYCDVCGGEGYYYTENGAFECEYCGGTGILWDWAPCEYCGGTGLATETYWVDCETCGGSGWVLQY